MTDRTDLTDRVINLTIHGIGAPERELEPGEDRTWISVERFEQVLDAVAGRPDVRLTFDDANRSDVVIGLPRLIDRGLTARFFLLAGLLGEQGRLTERDVGTLTEAGMLIGSHGWAHRDWRRVPAAEVEREFDGAHRLLSSVAGVEITEAAIPFGSYDRTVLRRLRDTGVHHVYTSDGGPANGRAWLQARTSMHRDLTPAWLAGVLDPRSTPVVLARRTAKRAVKRWR